MSRDKFFVLSKDEKRKFLLQVRNKLKQKKSSNPAGKEAFKSFPLMDIQDSYLLSRFPGSNPDYIGCHIYFEIEEDEVDATRLSTAWQKLISYHPMLRAKILSRGKQQVLEEVPSYEIEVFDYRDKDESAVLDHIQSIRQCLSHKVYELDKWPFFEICITHRSNHPDIIHFSIDDLIVDAFSVMMLLKQWRQIYLRPDLSLPQLHYTFKDYVAAVKKFEKTKRFQKDLNYWTEKLEVIPQGPNLTRWKFSDVEISNKFKPGAQLQRRRYQNTLDKSIWRLLKNRAKSLEVSPTALLLFLFSKFLLRWNKDQPFSLVLTMFGRMPFDDHVDHVLGACTSTSVFSVDNAQKLLMAEEVKQYQKVLRKNLDYSSVSSIRAFRELKRQGKLNQPLNLPVVFTSLLDFETDKCSVNEENWFNQVNYAITQTPGVVLDHHVHESDGHLKYNWDVVEKLFEPDLVGRMFTEYEAFLRAMAQGSYRHSDLWKSTFPQVVNAKVFVLNADGGDQEVEHGLMLTEDKACRYQDFPLSDLQQAYLCGKANENSDNKLCFYQEFEATDYDREKLKDAVLTLIETHEMLRAVIQSNGSQIILASVPEYEFKEIDLTRYEENEQNRKLARIQEELLSTDFKLDAWPFFSLSVSILSEKKARIHWSIDLLVADGYSINLIMNQLQQLYGSAEGLIALKELRGYASKVSFRDYMQAVNRYKNRDGYSTSVDYWHRKFSAISNGPQFSKWAAQAQIPSSALQRKRFQSVLKNGSTIERTAQNYGLPLNAVLLTAYNIVLRHFSESDEFTTVVVKWDRLPVDSNIYNTVGEFTALSWVETKSCDSIFFELAKQIDATVQMDLKQAPVSGFQALQKQPQLNFPAVFSDLTVQSPITESKTALIRGYGVTLTPGVVLDASAHAVGQDLHIHWDASINILPAEMLEAMLQAYQAILQQLINDTRAWLKSDFSDVFAGDATISGNKALEPNWPYWESRVPHLPEPPTLASGAAVYRQKPSPGGRREMLLEADKWRLFKENAKDHDLTPATAVCAVYAEVIAAWSNQRHFTLGHILEPQSSSGAVPIFYPLEIDLKKAHSLVEHGLSIQLQVEADAKHFLNRGEQLIQTLASQQGDPDRFPLPISIVNNLSRDGFKRPTLCSQSIGGTALDHQFNELADGSFWATFDELSDHFPAGLIDDMWSAYQSLIAGLSQDSLLWESTTFDLIPDQHIHTRQTIASESTAVSSSRLNDFLSGQREQAPVLQTSESQLHYGELEHDSNRLAVALRSSGISKGDHIAIVADRGPELLKFVYATLKADAVYIPVDPSLPEERRNYFLQNSQAKLALTQSIYRDQLNWPEGMSVLSQEDLGNMFSPAQVGDAFCPDSSAADMAYMIYTSGSTGQPKAVMIDHRGAVNTILDINSRFSVSTNDRIFGVSAFSFDLSVYDIFGTVAAGATLIYPDADKSLNATHWLELMSEQKVTIWNSAPPLAVLMIEAAERHGVSLPDLRLVMLSGDWIPVSLPDRIRQLAPRAKVVSLGGATEASIWSIFYEIDQVGPDWHSIPYGYPMTNQSWYILDDWGRATPNWVAGDLYIGGVGLALGYWGDTEKTESSFVQHPQTGERIYRTGDLGRYLPDGAIEFLGRSDFQVKVSGQRIELGEIETTLEKLDAIKQAVVLVKEQHTPRAKLVAYLVAKAEGTIDCAVIRESLKAKLPKYMVPNSFATLPALPFTPNGKIDRKALPWPIEETESQTVSNETSILVHDIDVGNELSELLNEYLETEEFSATDDLFDLGLTSFTSLQLTQQIEERYQLYMTAADLLKNSTLQGIQKYIENHLAQGNPKPADPDISDAAPAYESIADHSTRNSNSSVNSADIAKDLTELLKEYLETEDFAATDDLFDLGLTSFTSLQLTQQIEEHYQLTMTAADLLQNPTLERIQNYIEKHFSQKGAPVPDRFLDQDPLVRSEQFPEDSLRAEDSSENDLAIVGISCKLPGAENAEDFWSNIKSGKISVTEVSEQRLKLWPSDSANPGQHKYAGRWGGFLDDMECFDHHLFGISSVEARAMDPQERLCLESVWACLEDANYTVDSLSQSASRVGVFVAAMWNDYQNLGARSEQASNSILTSWHSAIANRISFLFDFQGPSVAIDTSCSSSLTAIHFACESLRRNECDVAVVSGVNVVSDPYHHKILSSMGILSDKENCFSFGSEGTGWIVGEGVGSLLIRHKNAALQSKDYIYGLIKGSAIGHSGATQRYGMPNSQAQAKCINKVINDSGIDINNIGYIECAAPGANLADAEEVSALVDVFKNRAPDSAPCLLGSVKPNIGHLESASAISQLMKLLMQFKYQEIAPSLNCESLNPLIRLDNTPFEINRDLTEWRDKQLAMINAIGGSGSSAHVIFEAYQNELVTGHQSASRKESYLIPLSAKTDAQLCRSVQRLETFISRQLGQDPELTAANIAYSLQIGREPLEQRLLIVSHNLNELLLQLSSYEKHCNDPLALSSQAIYTGDIHASLASHIDDQSTFKMAVQWLRGETVQWQTLWSGKTIPSKVPLPTYAFAREKHWAYTKDKDSVSSNSNTMVSLAENQASEQPRSKDDEHNLTAHISQQIAQYLESKSIEPCMDKTLMDLGIDSISMTWLKFELEQSLNGDIPISLLTRNLELAALVDAIASEIATKYVPQKKPNLKIVRDADCFKPFPLMDIQSAYLFGRISDSGLGQIGCHIYAEIEEVDLDIAKLTFAWQSLMTYHPMLRTNILPNSTQCVLQNPPLYDIEVFDYSNESVDTISAHIQSLRHRLSHKVYQAGQWPFFEICVTRRQGQKDIIHVSIDELIVDAFSFITLLKQWYQLYENPEFRLPNLDYTFRDYVLQLKAKQKTPQFKNNLAYWREKMQAMPDGPQLPINSKVSLSLGHTRRRYEQTLDKSIWLLLKNRAKAIGVYPTALLLLLFSELLSSRSQSAAFSLLLTVFNRTPFHKQVNQVLGPLISTNVFIVEEHRSLSLNEKLKRYQETLWQDMDHANVSSIRALRELKRRDASKADLVLPVVFTSMLSFDINVQRGLEKSWLDKVAYSVTQTPDVMFDHQVFEEQGALKYTWDIAEGIFPTGFIDEMFSAYENLLRRAASDSQLWETAPITISSLKPQQQDRSEKFATQLILKTDWQSRYDKFPLTDQQQAYVFGKMIEGANNKLLVYQEFDCDIYDRQVLNSALAELINRHEMLRAVVRSDNSQIILQAPPEYTVQEFDLSRYDEDRQQQELSKIRNDCLQATFKLGVWPFFSFNVSKLSSQKARIHFVIDMLIADGDSILLIMQQLRQCYDAGIIQQEASLPVPAISFRDYIQASVEYKNSPTYRQSINYWQQRFDNIINGPIFADARYDLLQEEIQRECYAGVLNNWIAIKEKARKYSLSPSLVLLTAYNLCIQAFCDSDAFTTVVVNWQRLPIHKDINKIVGDFTALSWVETNTDTMNFLALAQQFKTTVDMDLKQRPVSGLSVLRKLQNLSFPVVFTSLAEIEHPKNTDSALKMGYGISQTPQVLLDNISEEVGTELHFHWDAATNILSAAMVQSMFQSYQAILQRLSEDSQAWDQMDFSQILYESASYHQQKVTRISR